MRICKASSSLPSRKENRGGGRGTPKKGEQRSPKTVAMPKSQRSGRESRRARKIGASLKASSKGERRVNRAQDIEIKKNTEEGSREISRQKKAAARRRRRLETTEEETDARCARPRAPRREGPREAARVEMKLAIKEGRSRDFRNHATKKTVGNLKKKEKSHD